MAAQQTTEKVTGAAPSTKTGPSTTGSKVGKRAANGSHARTGTASDPPHICGICSKCFDRRDLRDRHKRRCARSSQKVKVSKRKSCLACAQSKLGCDLDTPACSRCVGRGTTCEYAVPPPSALSSANIRPPNITTNIPTSQPLHAGHGSCYSKQSHGMPYHTIHGSSAELSSMASAASGYPTPPFQESFLMPFNENYLGNQPFDLFASLTSQPFLPNDPRTPTSATTSQYSGFDTPELDPFLNHDITPSYSDWFHDNGVSPGYPVQQEQLPVLWHMHPRERHSAEIDHLRYPLEHYDSIPWRLAM